MPERRLPRRRGGRASSSAPGRRRRSTTDAGDWVAITAPARFLWIATHEPDVFASIAHVGMLGDWILTRLSRRVRRPTLRSARAPGCSTSPTRDWSDARRSSSCGLERSVFPPVVEPGTVVGAVTAAAATRGCARARPVVVGGADTQLGLLGIGVSSRAGSPSSAAASGSRRSSSTSRSIDPHGAAPHALPHRP